jgi:sec-independent protein translocase protein TatB
VFNLSGGEIVVLLLIGLVVLGPEKLPEAMRKFGRVYNEIRRVAGGIQRDVTSTFSEPVNELRKTADEARRIFTGGEPSTTPAASDARSDDPPFVPYEAPPSADTTETPNDGPAQ